MGHPIPNPSSHFLLPLPLPSRPQPFSSPLLLIHSFLYTLLPFLPSSIHSFLPLSSPPLRSLHHSFPPFSLPISYPPLRSRLLPTVNLSLLVRTLQCIKCVHRRLATENAIGRKRRKSFSLHFLRTSGDNSCNSWGYGNHVVSLGQLETIAATVWEMEIMLYLSDN